MVNDTQQIPAGYKQTDVGVIPEDWETINLGSIGVFSKGRGIKKYEANSGEIPCIRYGEIYTHHNDIIKFFNSKISSEVAKTSRKLKKGEILFAGSGETKEEIGKCVAYLHDLEAYAGGDIVILTPTKSDSMFLGYLLNSSKVNTQKASRGQGDAIVHISSSALSTVVISIPQDQKEQKKIAEALSDIDSLISKLDQLIQKKKNIKQGAMQELLTGKRRLPGFSGEWEEKRLGDLFNLSAASSKSKFLKDGGAYLVMDMGSVSTDGKNIARKKIDLAIDLLKTGNLVMPKDDIGGGFIIGKVAYIDAENTYVLGDHVYKLVCIDNNQNTLFHSYLINSHPINLELKTKVSGSAQLGLGKKGVEEQLLKIPKDKTEQTAIAKVLTDLDQEINNIKSQRVKYQSLRQGMMQQLLTGKIRLI